MKQTLIALLLFTLSACGSDQPAEPAPTAPAQEAEPVAEASEGPQVPAMVEFVWHQRADGFTEGDLWSHAKYWSNLAGEADWGLVRAAVMTPRFESEDFDFLWVMVWPTEESRNNAWADWSANHESAWLELTQNTFTYSAEHAYAFAPSPGRPVSVPNTSGKGIAEFLFCTYKEGKGETDRKAFEANHAAFMDTFEAEFGATSYWWSVMTPLFEMPDQDTPDYMWANFWPNDAEREAGWAAYNTSSHAASSEQDANCTDPAIFDSVMIYRPKA